MGQYVKVVSSVVVGRLSVIENIVARLDLSCCVFDMYLAVVGCIIMI